MTTTVSTHLYPRSRRSAPAVAQLLCNRSQRLTLARALLQIAHQAATYEKKLFVFLCLQSNSTGSINSNAGQSCLHNMHRFARSFRRIFASLCQSYHRNSYRVLHHPFSISMVGGGTYVGVCAVGA